MATEHADKSAFVGVMLTYTNTASSGARKRAMANALRGLRVAVYMVSCMGSYL